MKLNIYPRYLLHLFPLFAHSLFVLCICLCVVHAFSIIVIEKPVINNLKGGKSCLALTLEASVYSLWL